MLELIIIAVIAWILMSDEKSESPGRTRKNPPQQNTGYKRTSSIDTYKDRSSAADRLGHEDDLDQCYNDVSEHDHFDGDMF